MDRTPDRSSPVPTARIIAALAVFVLIVMAQLGHAPTHHGEAAASSPTVHATLVGTAGADCDRAVGHLGADCSGAGCGACAAALARAIMPGSQARPLHERDVAFSVPARPPGLPFRPPTHSV